MSNELLQALVSALIGAASGYTINQLPPLRNFRGSKSLITALIIELTLLAGIWSWLSSSAAKTSNSRELIEKIAIALLGAFIVNFIQTILHHRQNGTSHQLNQNQRTVIKKTRMIGKRNKTKISKKDAWIEDTEIRGQDQEFTVEDDPNPSNSSGQSNNPNP